MSAGEGPQAPTSAPETTTSAARVPEASQPVRGGAPRVHSGELISVISALLLLPIMFALEWFGKVGVPAVRRSGITGAENAWNGMTLVRWLMLATILLTLGAVVLHARQRGHGTRTATGGPVAALGTLLAASVAYRVLIDPPNSGSVVDIKLGAFLGLLATIGVALGGFESLREERARRGDLVQRSRNSPSLASGLPER